jgi:hypothetical protein
MMGLSNLQGSDQQKTLLCFPTNIARYVPHTKISLCMGQKGLSASKRCIEVLAAAAEGRT